MRLKTYLASFAALTLFFSANGIAQRVDECASHVYTSQTDRTKLAHITKKAYAGNPRAQFALAQVYETGAMGAQKDIVYAMSWYEEAARNGHRLASDNIRRLKRLSFTRSLNTTREPASRKI
jgi:TPR repeat protein